MRILFLSDNFPPEVNAPASRTWEHCRLWAAMGHRVTVITCAPNFPQGKVYAGYRNLPWQRETVDGIRVIRVWSYIAANKGTVRRMLDFVSFALSAFVAGLMVRADVVVATSPQFFTAVAGRALGRVKRRPWVMEVRDLWPESIKALGAMRDGILLRHLEWQEMRCYRTASLVVVVTDAFRRRLVERGVPADKIRVVTNGVDGAFYAPRPKDSEIRERLGLAGKTVVAYIGTHGMAHRLDFILRCAKRLDGRTRHHFMLLGDGAERDNLLRLRDRLALTNVTMLPSVPKAEVARYLSVADVCLINLRRDPLFTTVIPSKIFENAAMGIPILMGVRGEAQDIVERYGAGLCYEPEREDDFMAKLAALDDEATRQRCRRGCLSLAADYDRKALALRMLRSIEELVQ